MRNSAAFPAAPVIAVIDPDPDHRERLVEILETGDDEVLPFSRAGDWLAGGHGERGGCVITEFDLPDMHGLDLLTQINRNGWLPQVIFVATEPPVPVAVQAVQDGATTVLERPVEADSLINAVRRGMLRSAQRRAERRRQQDIQRRLDLLTPEEQLVMELVMAGVPSKTIAHRLNIGKRTVDRRRQSVLTKTAASSLGELAVMIAELKKPE